MKKHQTLIALKPVFAPAGILAVSAAIAIAIIFPSLQAFAGSLQYTGSSSYVNPIVTCGYAYNGWSIDEIDTNTCDDFTCDASNNGRGCQIITETGTVPSGSIGCDNSTGCAGGGMYDHVCRVDSYTCVHQTCTPNSSCAANTCNTGTCSDSCGNVYAGTKDCSVPCTASNSCGQSNSGTMVNGVCSASAPANPAGYGNSCSSGANSCGMVNYGSIQCNGTCSASTPSNSLCPTQPTCVSYQGQSCSASNSCGNQTNYGTYQCNGSCSASTPSDSSCPAAPSPSVSCTASATSVSVGGSVTYSANPADGASSPYTWTAGDGGSYGSASTATRTFSTAGTYAMNVRGTNTSTSYCPNVTVTSAAGGWCTSATPALSITAGATRVKMGQSTTISWSASGVNGQNASCTVTGPGVAWTSAVSASPSCSVPSSSSSATITGQSTYTLTCGSQSKSVTVNVIPNFTEF